MWLFATSSFCAQRKCKQCSDTSKYASTSQFHDVLCQLLNSGSSVLKFPWLLQDFKSSINSFCFHKWLNVLILSQGKGNNWWIIAFKHNYDHQYPSHFVEYFFQWQIILWCPFWKPEALISPSSPPPAFHSISPPLHLLPFSFLLLNKLFLSLMGPTVTFTCQVTCQLLSAGPPWWHHILSFVPY